MRHEDIIQNDVMMYRDELVQIKIVPTYGVVIEFEDGGTKLVYPNELQPL